MITSSEIHYSLMWYIYRSADLIFQLAGRFKHTAKAEEKIPETRLADTGGFFHAGQENSGMVPGRANLSFNLQGALLNAAKEENYNDGCRLMYGYQRQFFRLNTVICGVT